MRYSEMKANHESSGFTIVEVLVAILILGILMSALSFLLTGSFKLNRDSQRQINTASDAQNLIENVRNSWSTVSNYDNACAPSLIVPAGYRVQFTNLDKRAQPVNAANAVVTTPVYYDVGVAATCTPASGAVVQVGSPAVIPVMRRIVVQTGTMPSTGTTPVIGSLDTRLELDVFRP